MITGSAEGFGSPSKITGTCVSASANLHLGIEKRGRSHGVVGKEGETESRQGGKSEGEVVGCSVSRENSIPREGCQSK